MRLFTALDLPPEVLLRLERLTATLRPEAHIHWSPLDNLHITTKFIGEWPDDRLPDLDAALRCLPARTPFDIEVKELGWFPGERSPRVLWIGVQAGPELSDLARHTELCLAPLGIRHEERNYAPHLTLARIKTPAPLSRLREKVRSLQPAVIGQFTVRQFSLFRSDPGSNASLYRKLHEYSFTSTASASSA